MIKDWTYLEIEQDGRHLNVIFDLIEDRYRYFYLDELTGEYTEVKREHLKFLGLGFDDLLGK